MCTNAEIAPVCCSTLLVRVAVPLNCDDDLDDASADEDDDDYDVNDGMLDV